MKLIKKKSGYWLRDPRVEFDMGPYEDKDEAYEDANGMNRTFEEMEGWKDVSSIEVQG